MRKNLLLFLIATTSAGWSGAYAADFQWKNDIRGTYGVMEGAEVFLNTETVYTPSLGFKRGWIGYLEPGSQFSPLSWISVGAKYRLVHYFGPTGMKGYFEHRPAVYSTLKWELAGFKFDDRNQVEYRVMPLGASNVARYRNRFRVKFPFEVASQKLAASAYVEPHIEFNKNLLNKWENAIGLAWVNLSWLEIGAYYQHEIAYKKGAWGLSHLLFTDVGFKF